MVLPHVLLAPPLMEKDELEAFTQSGIIVSTAVSPRGNSLAVFAAATDVSHTVLAQAPAQTNVLA